MSLGQKVGLYFALSAVLLGGLHWALSERMKKMGLTVPEPAKPSMIERVQQQIDSSTESVKNVVNPSRHEVYRYTDSTGRTVYTNTPPQNATKIEMKRLTIVPPKKTDTPKPQSAPTPRHQVLDEILQGQ